LFLALDHRLKSVANADRLKPTGNCDPYIGSYFQSWMGIHAM